MLTHRTLKLLTLVAFTGLSLVLSLRLCLCLGLLLGRCIGHSLFRSAFGLLLATLKALLMLLRTRCLRGLCGYGCGSRFCLGFGCFSRLVRNDAQTLGFSVVAET